MAYKLQNFENGKTLYAEQLNVIDSQVKKISDSLTVTNYVEIEQSSIVTGYLLTDNGDISGSSNSTIYEYTDIDFENQNYYVTCRYGTNTSMYACELQDKNGLVLARLFLSDGTVKVYERYDISSEIASKNINRSDIGVIRLAGSKTSGGITPKLEVGTESIPSFGNPADIVPIMNYGKTIAVFGGSQSTLERGAGVAQDIWNKHLNFAKIANYGVGGSGFVRSSNGKLNIVKQVEKALSEGIPYDIWVLQCSTNDWKYGVPCGTYEDEPTIQSEITTQCGGINYCIRRICETYPAAKVYLFTSTRFFKTKSTEDTSSSEYFDLGDSAWNPFSKNGVNGHSLKHFVDAQKECCLKHDVPVLDLYGCTTYNEYNYSQYFTSDNIHWNEAGYVLHGYLQAQFLLNGI